MYTPFIIMLNAVHATDIIQAHSHNVLKGKLLWGGWTSLDNSQCQILHIEVTKLYSIHVDYIIQSNYLPKGKQQGGGSFSTYILECIQSIQTMINSQIMDNLPFANVADNVMFDKTITQNVYCNINKLPSSNNDVLNDMDPDINNLIPNCLKNLCKDYNTSSELKKDIICFQNNIALLHTNICSSCKKTKRFYLLHRSFNYHFQLHRIKGNMGLRNESRST